MSTFAKRILRFLFQTDHGNIVIIVGVAIFIFILWCRFIGMYHFVCDDTATYFFAGEVFTKGDIDYLRTPVYPLICSVFLHLFGNYVFDALATLNLVIFLFSIAYLYKTIALFTQRRAIKCISTILYAWSIPMAEMCIHIATESLSVSGIVYLIYGFSLIYLGKASKSTIYKNSATLLFLVLLRPFNLCFIPVMLLVLFSAHRKHRLKYVKTSAIAVSSVAVILCGYCFWFRAVYGFFGFSYVSTINALHITHKTHRDELWKSNIELFETIGNEKCLLWIWLNHDYNKKHVAKVLLNNRAEFCIGKIKFFGKTCYLDFPHYSTNAAFVYLVPILCLHMGTLFVILLLLILFEIYLSIRKHRTYVSITSIHLLICVISIFTAIVGSSNYGAQRLAMPMFPSLCLLVGLFAEQTNLRFTNSVKPQYNFNKS